MRVKIRLDTIRDASEFTNIANRVGGEIVITDSTGFRVNAKSVLGTIYAMEFTELWCESEKDIYREIEKFVVLESY